MKIPYNKPFIAGNELTHIQDAVENGQLAGNGKYTKLCQDHIKKVTHSGKVLLTTSCTSALEMSAKLINLKINDEVLMSPFTFVSTANAFLMSNAKPVFVDIRENTLNIDELKIEEKISSKTKAICPVHYAGISCEMTKILQIAKENKLLVIEDAAQGFCSTYNNMPLGSMGDMSTFSFHETKNFIAGEGGALLINNPKYFKRSEIIWEKGTNRASFFRGEIDKYTWVDIGSSYLPSELIAAFLYGQFEKADIIKQKRLQIWNYYFERLSKLEENGMVKLPVVPNNCEHNGHIFYILTKTEDERDNLLNFLKQKSIGAIFHFIPLHESPMGWKLGYKRGMFPIAENISRRIIRLPLFFKITKSEQDFIIRTIFSYYEK